VCPPIVALDAGIYVDSGPFIWQNWGKIMAFQWADLIQ
jgi:hypothetical protein